MRQIVDDGGPAFPSPGAFDADTGKGRYAAFGMSIRDYFAGQALAGICGDGIPGSHHRPEQVAADAYALADAMIAARKSGGAANG